MLLPLSILPPSAPRYTPDFRKPWIRSQTVKGNVGRRQLKMMWGGRDTGPLLVLLLLASRLGTTKPKISHTDSFCRLSTQAQECDRQHMDILQTFLQQSDAALRGHIYPQWANLWLPSGIQKLTSSSAVAKRPRDASYLSVVSFISAKRRAQSFIVSYIGYRFISANN